MELFSVKIDHTSTGCTFLLGGGSGGLQILNISPPKSAGGGTGVEKFLVLPVHRRI